MGLVAFVAPAQAAPGDLDPTFSGDGKEMTDFGKNDSASGVVLQPDGKIVVAGSSRFEVTQCGDDGCVSESHADSALARYNPDGTLDTSFSGDGKDTTDFGAAYDVALQPDGKIVVVGAEGFTRCADIWCDAFVQFAVARYNPDGTLDTSFSDDGKQAIGFGNDTAYGVAIQTDGKIVVAGSSVDPSGNGADDFVLARYNADGTVDTSFSDDGKQVTDFGGSDKGAYGLALQPDGKIVAVGRTSGDDFALARYAVDGSLDTTFDGDGMQTTDLAGWDEGRAVAIQDDKIVVAGTTNRGAFVGDDDFALARYNADGSLDTTFSGDGKQNTNFGIGEHDSASGILLQRDGKIVAVGSSTAGGDTSFALARYAADGSLDTSFSGDGQQHTDFGDAASDVALQPDGRIVVAGSGGGDFALARYEGGSGSSDTDPPETTIAGGPTGTTSDGTPTFTFSSSEPGSTFECRVDGEAFSPCSSPHTTSSLGDGPHTFEVRATDGAGNTDPTPASQSWTIVADYRGEVLGTSGLVSYWRLGETSGTTAVDAKRANIGGYRSGVLLGRPSALLHDANPSAGFDGSNDYVSVADHASLDAGDRFTLEAWVKRSSSSSSTKTVLSKGSGSWRLSFVNDVLTLTKAGSGTIATASVSTTDTTGFHHVVAAKSGAVVRLYIDGVDRTGTISNRTIANTSTALNIGRYTSGSEYFPGLIDEVAIYNLALSHGEVQRHFKASGR